MENANDEDAVSGKGIKGACGNEIHSKALGMMTESYSEREME